ncbi:MAG: hypothetical protein ACRDJV_10270 [Actinomycetota bacterium]
MRGGDAGVEEIDSGDDVALEEGSRIHHINHLLGLLTYEPLLAAHYIEHMFAGQGMVKKELGRR